MNRLLHSLWVYYWYEIRYPIRLRIAYWLEDRYPERYCWADLVMWAYTDGHTLEGAAIAGARCKADPDEGWAEGFKQGVCYCGKFRK